MSSDLIFDVEQHLGIITLNRARALNALTFSMILALQDQLEAWSHDEAVHAIVIRSNSDKAFCAGGDVRQIYEAGLQRDPQQLDFFKNLYPLSLYISQLKKPYIVLMNGVTMGGGIGISLHGSHPVASERFVFAMPETSIGFFPDIGASFLFSRCMGHYGVFLGLTGNRLNAQEAYHLGLVKHIIAQDKHEAVLEALKQMDLSIDAYARVEDCLYTFTTSVDTHRLFTHQSFVQDCFQYDTIESILSALDKGHDAWHQQIKHSLMQKAPLSLKVTLAQILKARGMPLADCLQMDMRLVRHFMQDHDFYEGIRALLIDKDKTPKWCPDRLDLVTSDQVAAYFEK